MRQQSELEDLHVSNVDLKQRLEILGEQTNRKISLVSREHRSLHEGSFVRLFELSIFGSKTMHLITHWVYIYIYISTYPIHAFILALHRLSSSSQQQTYDISANITSHSLTHPNSP